MALIVQLGEHCTGIAEVVGSNPAQSLKIFSGLCSSSVTAALALMTVITQLLLWDKLLSSHIIVFCEKVYFIFTVPLVTFINTKGNICLEEFLMLLMDRSFNPFAVSNKQAHILSVGIYLSCVTMS